MHSGNTCTDGGFSGRFDTKAEYLWTQSRILGRWSTCISQDAGKGSEMFRIFLRRQYLNRQRAAVVGALGIRLFKMGR